MPAKQESLTPGKGVHNSMLVMSFFDDVNQLPQQIAGEYLCFHREFINALIKVAHDDLFLIVRFRRAGRYAPVSQVEPLHGDSR